MRKGSWVILGKIFIQFHLNIFPKLVYYYYYYYYYYHHFHFGIFLDYYYC